MTETTATMTVKQIAVEAVVMRAVPCSAHKSYVADCPICLTGEEAHARGIVEAEDLGTIAHYHSDQRRQADKGLLSRGIRIWRK